jgi:hypothetical protein
MARIYAFCLMKTLLNQGILFSNTLLLRREADELSRAATYGLPLN